MDMHTELKVVDHFSSRHVHLVFILFNSLLVVVDFNTAPAKSQATQMNIHPYHE